MDKLKPEHITLLLPFALLLHIFDEYFSGICFAGWFSGVSKVSLSVSDFIVINSIGFATVVGGTILLFITAVQEELRGEENKVN